MIKLSYKMFLKALSNDTRLEIISLLVKGPKSVTEICNKLKFEQSRVSHNLKCLESCGFVDTKWKGKNRIYSLDKKHIIPILKNMEEHIKDYNTRLRTCGVIK